METDEYTYTFSRALHLMRYGGKKMKLSNWTDDTYLFVENNTLFVKDKGVPIHGFDLSSYWIMSSWVEVK